MIRLSSKELSVIGEALYICEGTRKRIDNRGHTIQSVEFTNKDERTIKMFLRFLREVIKADEKRIKAELFIYPDHNESKLMDYWMKITSIPVSRFNKTIRLKQKNVRFKPNPFGTLKIRYCHKEHFLKINGIIETTFGEVA